MKIQWKKKSPPAAAAAEKSDEENGNGALFVEMKCVRRIGE